MPTLPVVKSKVNMNGDDHTFLTDSRFADLATSCYASLSADLSLENVTHILELALAYEYDCAVAKIGDKPEKWIVD